MPDNPYVDPVPDELFVLFRRLRGGDLKLTWAYRDSKKPRNIGNFGSFEVPDPDQPDAEQFVGRRIEVGNGVITWVDGIVVEDPPVEINDPGPDTDGFLNPYHWIPALPRLTDSTVEFGDRPPVGHHADVDDRYTGHIKIEITTTTPLLVVDGAGATKVNGAHVDHSSFGMRSTSDDEGNRVPILPRTSLKGALRSSFEAVTGSRFGVLDRSSGDRLGYRLPPQISQRMVPVRVSDDGKRIELLTGFEQLGSQLARPARLHAAWLPAYPDNPHDSDGPNGLGDPGRGGGRRIAMLPNDQRPGHRQTVHAWVQKVQHYDRRGNHDFDYWRAEAIWTDDDEPPGQPTGLATTQRHHPTNEWRQITGWVVSTGRNIGNKHDERIFFAPPNGTPVSHELDGEPLPSGLTLRQHWGAVLGSYEQAHTDRELDRISQNGRPTPRHEYSGRDIGQTAWSRHLHHGVDERNLDPGTLLYAQIDNNRKPVGLYPVAIAREVYEASPLDLLDPSVRPAGSIDQLSPADRVFGWVQSGKADTRSSTRAVRGSLRVGPVSCITPDAIATGIGGDDGLPLAILGAPKPSQGRFYVLGDNGQPLEHGTDPKDTYRRQKRRIGRKTYVVHGTPDDYWSAHQQASRDDGRTKEYRRASDERDSQNRTITEWVKPGTTFCTSLEFRNLSAAELGALLWMLDPSNVAQHQLGGAKPLGFGACTIHVSGGSIHTGQELRDRYSQLAPTPGSAPEDLINETRVAYISALDEVLSTAGRRRVLEAVTRSSHPYQARVHYPRTDPTPDPQGENYRWFVANDSLKQNGRVGERLTLGSIGSPLPYDPTHPAPPRR